MRRGLLIALGTGLLFGCGPASKTDAGPSDEAYKVVMVENLKNHLRDPASAIITGEYFSRKSLPALCGYVNSRNGFGGMTGRQRFISTGAVVIEEEMAPGEMDKAWAQFC